MIHARARKKLGDFILDAEISDEGFICLTGHNGAGKSTLLGIIAGTLKGDSVLIEIGSRDVTDLQIDKRGVVLVTPESYIPHLSVERHLLWGAKGRVPDNKEIKEMRSALGITFSGKLRQLSLGMRERVGLGTAILSHPKAILVDETFSNINNRREFISEFRRLCSAKYIDVIFTTQYPEDADLSDHLYEMSDGKIKRVR